MRQGVCYRAAPQTPFAAAIVANDIAAIEAQVSQVLGLAVTVSQLLQQQAEQFTSGHSTPVTSCISKQHQVQ